MSSKKKNATPKDLSFYELKQLAEKEIEKFNSTFNKGQKIKLRFDELKEKISLLIASLSDDVTFDKLSKLVVKEIETFYSAYNNGQEMKLSLDELKENISVLIARNVFLIGIKPKCNTCGLKNWYHADDIKQKMKCAGCGNIISTTTEEKWFYRLNSLIGNCYNDYNILPVVLVLGQLNKQSKQSFEYESSYELYEEGKDKPLTDLDIVCVSDGKFIIGEVKEKAEGFEMTEVDKLVTIAKNIRPDILLFSSMDEKPTEKMKKKIEEIKNELKDYEIEVKWECLDRDIFMPSTFFRSYS